MHILGRAYGAGRAVKAVGQSYRWEGAYLHSKLNESGRGGAACRRAAPAPSLGSRGLAVLFPPSPQNGARLNPEWRSLCAQGSSAHCGQYFCHKRTVVVRADDEKQQLVTE